LIELGMLIGRDGGGSYDRFRDRIMFPIRDRRGRVIGFGGRVLGDGVAGMSAATVAASRGHAVTLFEANNDVGGQFNLAKVVPGKEEFHETIRYFKVQLKQTGVDVRLNTKVNREQLEREGFDEVVIATGVVPRALKIQGSDAPQVLSYAEVLKGAKVGHKVAVIGAGGIGFDVSEFLLKPPHQPQPQPLAEWQREWGVDPNQYPTALFYVAINKSGVLAFQLLDVVHRLQKYN
jgi:NADPH-dependent glutamate synthase beta subunit-like oxidoreductase